MPHRFEGERTLMRIFLGDSDRCAEGAYKGRPLYEAIVLLLREKGFAGATVVRGTAGFGAAARLHTGKILRLSQDLPVIVEVVEREETIRAALPELDRMIGGGLITLEKAHVILYRPEGARDSERWDHMVQGLEPGDAEA
jgi:PII-like signaling protein